MSKERDILKSLLFKEELELLDDLKKKMLSKAQFTQEVSRVLSGAVKSAHKKGDEFEKSLSAPIKKGVYKIFAENKQSIIDAIMPIMGQLIRKTVTNSIKQFVADINRTLELGFSSKALKWRWQAFKSGEKFADIVFQKTIHYQITEMFVINHENGLLIQHVGIDADEVLKDNDALSAMLTVLQDFIGDSLKSSESGLLSIEISDKQFLISTGPHAYLASVVKGSPTERLKDRLQQLIEYIHSDYSELIADQNQYQNNLEFSDYLQGHLITKSISDSEKALNWKPWVIIILLVVIGFSYWSYQRNKEFSEVDQLVHATPGLFVQNIERKSGDFVVTGLLDPRANINLLKEKNIKLITRPYISLDQEIIQGRVNKLLVGYKEIDAIVKDNTVILSGIMTEKDSLTLINQLNSLNGIDAVINQIEIDTKDKDAQLAELLKAINAMKYIINNSTINLPRLNAGNSEEKQKLNKVIESTQFLLKNQSQTRLSIIGESDCNGKKSDDYSQQRAKTIKDIFINNNIDEKSMQINFKPCVIFTFNENKSDLNVRFTVQ